MRKVFVMRDYQERVREWIIDHARCVLAVFMGAGKTVTVLTALEDMSLADEVYPALVLAPLRVAKSTWPGEAAMWEHLKHLVVVPIVGDVEERTMAARRFGHVYTTNYENIAWLSAYWGENWPYKTIVADESTRLKGFRLKQGGVRAQALGKVAHRKTKRFIELTGTIAPNGLQDLWGQLWFIDIGERLGRTFEAFKQRWFQRSHTGYGLDPLPFAQKEIQERLADVCLAIDAKDYFDLKEPIITDVFVDLPMKARKHYAEMEKDMFTQIGQYEIEAFGAAARTQKCLQIANGASYVEGSNEQWEVLHDAKLDALESILEEAGGMPLLVAYQFKSDLARLLKRFPQGKHLGKDTKTIDDFNAGKIPILFAHPASAGHGLSLQHGTNIIVYFAVDWNLENHLQVLERIGPVRQAQSGYDRNVFVYRILARDTVDELVLDRLTTKRDVQEILIEAMKRKAPK